MEIGDTVKKKSGKPFQNKSKECIITSFTTITIPKHHPLIGTKTVDAVYLQDCVGAVRLDILEISTLNKGE